MEEIIKKMLGELNFQIAQLVAENEALRAELAKEKGKQED